MDTDTDDPASPSYRSCPLCIVIHLRAVDFPNVASGMKAVVAGFVDKAKDRGFVQGVTVCLPGESVEIMCALRGEESDSGGRFVSRV